MRMKKWPLRWLTCFISALNPLKWLFQVQVVLDDPNDKDYELLPSRSAKRKSATINNKESTYEAIVKSPKIQAAGGAAAKAMGGGILRTTSSLYHIQFLKLKLNNPTSSVGTKPTAEGLPGRGHPYSRVNGGRQHAQHSFDVNTQQNIGGPGITSKTVVRPITKFVLLA